MTNVRAHITAAAVWRRQEQSLERDLADAQETLAQRRESLTSAEEYLADTSRLLEEWRALGRSARVAGVQ